MLQFVDPCGTFYATTAQAVSGLYNTCAASIVTSGLPAGNIESTAFKNVTNLQVQVPITSGPYYCGFRFNPAAPIGASQNLIIFADGSNNPQVTFQTNTNGTITARRGGGSGTILGTSSLSTVLTQNVWSFIEFGMTCNGTTGTIDIVINGTSVLHLTAQNTQGQASTDIAAVQILGANISNYIQDLYITDSTGSHNTGFLGDISAGVYYATANGTFTAYTPNGAATIWQSVNAATPADGAVFASDATPGDRMNVKLASTSVTGTILGVNHITRMQKDATGTRTAAQTLTNNGVDVIGPTQSLNTSYAYYQQIAEVDPNTGLSWTVAGFNTIQTGVETIS